MNRCVFILLLLLTIYSYSQTDYLPITNKGKWGVVNSNGNILIEPKFNFISLFKNEIAICREGSSYGLINPKGQKITLKEYSKIARFSRDSIGQLLYLVKNKGKQGIINELGKEVVPLNYLSIKKDWSFFICEKETKKIDVLTFGGELTLSRYSDSIQVISHDFFISYEDSNKVLLDFKGKELFRCPTFKVESKRKGNLLVLNYDKMVFFNTNFEKVIDTSFLFLNKKGNMYEFKDSLNDIVSYSFTLNRFFYEKNISEQKRYGKYLIVKRNDKIGVVDSSVNQVLPYIYKSIQAKGNYFYGKTFDNKTALFNNDFKMLTAPVYNEILETDFGFVSLLNGKSGVLNKKGKKITEAKFSYIDLKSIPLKCYTSGKGMVQLIFDKNWKYLGKKEFKNYISFKSKWNNNFKELLLENTKGTLLKSGIVAPVNVYGWFSDSVEVVKEDSTRLKIKKWGLKNKEGLVITKAVFKDFAIVNDSISLAYKGKRLKGKSKKRIKDIPVLSPFTVVNHLTGEILRKQSFYALNTSGFKGSNLICGLNKNGICLVDRSFNLVEKGLHYATFPLDSMLRYSILDKDKKAPFLEDKMVTKLNAWRSYGSGVDFDKNKSELYNSNVQPWEKRYFKPYITKRIKFGFYNTLTNKKAFMPQFDYATNFNKGVAFVGVQESEKAAVKYGVISKEKIIAPLVYSQVNYFKPKVYDSLYLLTLNNGRSLFIDSLLNIKETELTHFSRIEKDVIIAKDKNKYGILDDNLNWVMEPSFRQILVSDNNKLISKEKLHGVVSEKGVNLAPVLFKKKFVLPLEKGALLFQNKAKTGKVGYYNYEYGELFKPFKGVVFESESFLLKVENNVPFYYKNGELLNTKKVFSCSTIFENDKYTIKKKGKNNKIINKITNKKVKKKDLIITNVSEEGIYFYNNESKGLLNYKGDTLIKALKYLDLVRIEDSLILSSRKSVKGRTYKYGLLNLKGELIQPCNYNKVEKVFDNVYFCFRSVGLSLFLSKTGDTLKVLECKSFESTSERLMIYRTKKGAFFVDSTLSYVFNDAFYDAEPFVKGIATVQTKEGWQVMNRLGELISIASFQSMKPIAKNTVLAIEKPKKGICNYKGELIVPVEYESINSVSSTLLQVIKEGKVGYISTKGKWIYNPF